MVYQSHFAWQKMALTNPSPNFTILTESKQEGKNMSKQVKKQIITHKLQKKN